MLLKSLLKTPFERLRERSLIMAFNVILMWFLGLMERPCFATLSPEQKAHYAERVARERRIAPEVVIDLWKLIQQDLAIEGFTADTHLIPSDQGSAIHKKLSSVLNHFPYHFHSHVPRALGQTLERYSSSPFWPLLFQRLTEEIKDLEEVLFKNEIQATSPLEVNRNYAVFQQNIDQLATSAPFLPKPFDPLLDQTNEQPSFGDRHVVGISVSRGRRDYMEDRTNLGWTEGPENALSKKGIREFGFVGVFDGHGGTSISAEAATVAHRFILGFLSKLSTSELQDNEIVRSTLEASFDLESAPPEIQSRFAGLTDLNTHLKKRWEGSALNLERILLMASPGRTIGSTVLQAIFLDHRVFFVHLGDSRAILIKRDGTTERLTRDHRPAEEAAMIQARGGQVSYGSTPRVNGTLAMSRALGDWEVPGLIRKPDVTLVDLKKENPLAILLESDGVHEGIRSDSHLCEMILKLLPTKKPFEIAAQIIQQAYSSGSEDNLSAVIITPRPAAPPIWTETDQKLHSINGAPK